MSEEIQAWSVSEFIGLINDVFTRQVFPGGVAVEGEVAEYRMSQGKWIWFRLKDGESTVECFATVWQLRTPLEDGMQVRVFAKPRIHPKSGKFSLNVERAEPIGEGALRRAFELLRRKLESEGVFDVERKRPIPAFPERIGLIASRESAAYSDFLRILGARFGGVQVNSFHVQVQGQDAVSDIERAFRYFNAHPESADVIVLTRGGGSLEDLQAFNSEEVVRAVFSSRIPVICAVGHERDESLADYAADVRASTPTHAAELVVPDRAELAASIEGYRRRLASGFASRLQERRSIVVGRVTRLDSRFRVMIGQVNGRLRDFAHVGGLLARQTRQAKESAAEMRNRLIRLMDGRLARQGERLRQAEKIMAAMNPRRPLDIGYALVTDASGALIRSAGSTAVGQALGVEFRDGELEVQVRGIKNK